jgi:ADP-ribosylglycohydrolase
MDEQRITRLMLPFTHRVEAAHLEIADRHTEWALLTLRALLAAVGDPTPETFLVPWQNEVCNRGHGAQHFSERAAIENLRRGLLHRDTGNDNPLHYETAPSRGPSDWLFCAGVSRPRGAAAGGAQITQAEVGIYAARGMAAAIALLAAAHPWRRPGPRPIGIPPDSGSLTSTRFAQESLRTAVQPDDLTVLLTARVINTVYSYGSAAPETFPAALVIATACDGQVQPACWLANTLAKSADSLPAMVGALCGASQGIGVFSPIARGALPRAGCACPSSRGPTWKP